MDDLAGRATFNALLKPDVEEEKFAFVDPPFNFNAPEVAKLPAEVTGLFLLNSLCRRLGWSSLAGRRLLDFGCGVRFTRTLMNLSMDIDFYAGIDANKEVISWLQSEIRDRRFRFEHLDMFNHMYHANGSSSVDEGALQRLALADFDAACMFSVITHQMPNDSELIFSMLYRCVKPGGSLYFTAFIDETVRDYVERDPSNPCHMSTYHPDFLIELVRGSGWSVERTYLKSPLQQTAFVCRKPSGD
jgi:SAM-dependent methyltransferase